MIPLYARPLCLTCGERFVPWGADRTHCEECQQRRRATETTGTQQEVPTPESPVLEVPPQRREAAAEGKATRREQAIARVLVAVQHHPGAAVLELADTLKVCDKTVRRHLKALERSGDVVGQQESSKHPRRFWPKPAEGQGAVAGQNANSLNIGQ
ncbi:MAG: hypothetical protein ACHQ7N_14640 [Candidatus Methylomirabilales bacterium]